MYIWQATKIILSTKIYLITFLGLSVLILWFLIFLPASTIPGNDFAFQLSLFTLFDLLLLSILSGLTALSLIFNIFLLISRKKKEYGVSLLGQGITGIVSGMIASLFGSATCSACVFTFLSFLGFSGVVFLHEYRIPITLAAVFILTISLYLTSHKIMGVCNSCKI